MYASRCFSTAPGTSLRPNGRTCRPPLLGTDGVLAAVVYLVFRVSWLCLSLSSVSVIYVDVFPDTLLSFSLSLCCRYRGGYTKAQRRDLEQKLFSGALLGLTTTNALELGIDVGGLDVTLHLGVPSSQSSLVRVYGLLMTE